MLNVLSAFLTLVFFSWKTVSANDDLFSLGDVLRANTNVAQVNYKGESSIFNGQDVLVNGQVAQIRSFNFSLDENVLNEFKALFPPQIQSVFEIGNTFDSIVSLSSLKKYEKNFRWANGILPRKVNNGAGDLFVFEKVFFVHNFYPEAPGLLFLPESLKNNPLFYYSLTLKFAPSPSEGGMLSQKLPTLSVRAFEAPNGDLTLGDVFEAVPSLELFEASWKVRPYNKEDAFFTVRDKKYQLIQVAFERSENLDSSPKTLGEYKAYKDKRDQRFKAISFYSRAFEVLECQDLGLNSAAYYKILVQAL